MRKLFLALVIFHAAFNIGFAQQTTIDSLQNALVQENADTAKAEILFDIAELYLGKGKVDSARIYFDASIKALENAPYEYRHRHLAHVFYAHSNARLSQECLKYSKLMHSLSQKADDPKYLGIYYWVEAARLNLADKLDSALKVLHKALTIFEELDDQRQISWSHQNIAIVKTRQREFVAAYIHAITALELNEKYNQRNKANRELLILSQLNLILYEIGNYEEALASAKRIIRLRYQSEKPDYGRILNEYMNISTAYYYYTDRNDLALSYVDSAFLLASKMSHPKLQNTLNLHKAMVLVDAEMYSEASELGSEEDYSTLWPKKLEEGGISYTRGAIAQHKAQYSKAATLLERSAESFALAKEYRATILALERLIASYNALKDFEKSTAALVQLSEIQDSLQKQADYQSVMRLELEYELRIQQERDSTNAYAQRQQEQFENKRTIAAQNRRQIYMAIGSLLLIILAGGIYSRLRYVRKSKAKLQVEKDRSENLLLNILPEEIAQELKEKGKADARDFEMVSILFTDFKGFTEQSAKLSAADLVNEINHCFEAFDGIMEKYGIEKIKTIGDAYMAAGGLPVPTDDSVKNTVLAALEMQEFIVQRHQTKVQSGEAAFEMRVGIHTGPVVAGIVGVKKFQYDIWGDTVNTASRMESSGYVGKVNISQATYELLKDDAQFQFDNRGRIEAKGKGEMEMYYVSLNS